jgi:hypothetical protein
VFYFPHQSPNNTLIGMLEHSGFPAGKAVPHPFRQARQGWNTLGPHLFHVWCVPGTSFAPWVLVMPIPLLPFDMHPAAFKFSEIELNLLANIYLESQHINGTPRAALAVGPTPCEPCGPIGLSGCSGSGSISSSASWPLLRPRICRVMPCNLRCL